MFAEHFCINKPEKLTTFSKTLQNMRNSAM